MGFFSEFKKGVNGEPEGVPYEIGGCALVYVPTAGAIDSGDALRSSMLQERHS